ncbi:MAG: hypothetical protein HYW90_04120 [Candidatus Sungbacteria bacterium]|nr:hypothetical protein [Candidatus Sungbacteria bacterium]
MTKKDQNPPLEKWQQFTGASYKLHNLGRPAVFLLPSKKLRGRVEKELHAFLIKHFEAYTTTLIPSFGFWRDRRKSIIYDECRQYEVSFVGKEKIPLLLKKLAGIAGRINEECIYFKAGQYTCLIAPQTRNRKSK